MKTKILTLILFLTSFNGFSQQQGGQELIDNFFNTYESKSPEEALIIMFGTNEWMDVNSDAIKNVIYELQKNINLIGDYIGYEQIKSREIGSRFRITSYFVYYERQPLRFTFELYKNTQGWMLWNFKFDSDYDNEIEESMKLYRFKELSDWE